MGGRDKTICLLEKDTKEKSGSQSGSTPVQYHMTNENTVIVAVHIYGFFSHIYYYLVTINSSKDSSVKQWHQFCEDVDNCCEKVKMFLLLGTCFPKHIVQL